MNRNYAKPKADMTPEFAPDVLVINGRKVYNPKAVHYRIAGFKPLYDNNPGLHEEGKHWERTGTQWIDTGLSMRVVTSIDARVLFTMDRWQTIAGGTAYNVKYVGESNSKWLLMYGSSASGGEVVVNTWYDIEARMDENAATLTVDGTQVLTASSGRNSADKMGLFARERYNSGADGYMYGKITYARFYSDGTLVRDYIPVRFTNELGQTEGAMYDRANPTVGMNPDGSARTDGLYRNRGTGAFVIGPDKSAANGGGYKRKCVRCLHRRSWRPSARFRSPSVALAKDGWHTRLWKEVA